MQFLQTFGVAVTVLAVLTFGIWKVLGWVAKELIVPTRDLFFTRIAVTLARLEGTTDGLAKAEAELIRILEARTQKFDRIEQLLAVISGNQVELKAELSDLRLEVQQAMKK